MKDMNDIEYKKLKKYAENQSASDTEKALFSKWLSDTENRKEKNSALYELWNNTHADIPSHTDEALQDVLHKIDSKYKKAKIFHWDFLRKIAVAAVLVISSITATYIAVSSGKSDFAIEEKSALLGQVETILLPDGTVVTLNSGSTILYPAQFTSKKREVHLVGEANFDVFKNPSKPFVVHTKQMSVTALGTMFNVSSFQKSEEITTTLLEGSIEVLCTATQERVILKPGEQLNLNVQSNLMVKSTPKLDVVTAWQAGELIFDSNTIPEILDQIGVRFNKYIQYNPDTFNKDCYSLHFRRHETFDDIMSVLQTVSSGFKYRDKNGICYIYK